ncbi:hypothetical protein OEZ85_008586 [Tetradesmus obliquus]|uniref:Uncharacterized protein n=1 Tax=Tetradesmus obliquus TaxID=3088 RepID=A0ABY8TJG6_TETOB|nr:hypothetical protein OEZ85_008586 [Tetradesmus obliquus]
MDAHLTRLAMLPAAAALLRQMQAALQPELGATSRLGRMKGVVEHMAAGGALPAAAEAANSAYTLELLDLRLAGRGWQRPPLPTATVVALALVGT